MHNEQAFLEMFGTKLSASIISIMHSDGDADLHVVSSALTLPIDTSWRRHRPANSPFLAR